MKSFELPEDFGEWMNVICDVFSFEDKDEAFAAANVLALRFLDAGFTFRKMTPVERVRWGTMRPRSTQTSSKMN